MNVLTRYIVKEILKGSFIALILLLTLFNLFTLTDELKNLGKGSYNLSDIFTYLSLYFHSWVFYGRSTDTALHLQAVVHFMVA